MYIKFSRFLKKVREYSFETFLQKRCFYLFHFIFDLWPYAFTTYNPYKHKLMTKKRKKISIYDIFQIKSHSYKFHALLDKLQEGKVKWHVYMLLNMYVLFSRNTTSWLIFFYFLNPTYISVWKRKLRTPVICNILLPWNHWLKVHKYV